MRRSPPLLLPVLLALGASAPTLAYTPESGVWWNPAEPGTGLQIEIQDNFLAMSGYVFTPAGAPLWVTAQGFLDSNRTSFRSTGTATDGSWLNTFRNGQCIGCSFAEGQITELGSQGPVQISFDPNDETRAVLIWGGRNVPIERFQFYLVRNGDGVNVHTSKMLGEWNLLLDLSQEPGIGPQVFGGDVLVIDQIFTALPPGRSSFAGCRPDNILTTGCSASAREFHDVAGFFDVDTSRHVILMTDRRNINGLALDCLLYDVKVGSNSFEGGMDGDLVSLNDGGVIRYPCGTGDVFALPAYPVRGFRSASRTQVEAGTASSKRGVLPDVAATPPTPETRAAAALSDASLLQRRLDIVRQLEKQIGVR